MASGGSGRHAPPRAKLIASEQSEERQDPKLALAPQPMKI